MEKANTAKYADLFAALGSEPRLEIMRLLCAAYPQAIVVGEMQAKLQIPNSTLSHHLEKLRQEGLVSSQKQKQYIWYKVNKEIIAELLSYLSNGCAYNSKENPVVEPPRLSTETGLMFEFLKSIESFYSNVFDRVALPRGFERFTQTAMQAIFLAQDESRRLEHQYVGTEQILLGLIGTSTGIAAQVLSAEGINLENTRLEVEKRIGRGRGTPADVPFTPRAKQVLELSVEWAKQLGDRYIGTEHLLLGILREKGGMAVRVLETLGVNLQHLEQRILQWDDSK